MSSILFVCTGNTCRSVMAEYLLRHMLEKAGVQDVAVSSRGVMELDGRPASRGAMDALQAAGIDANAHRSRVITKTDIHDADLILTMEEGHRQLIQIKVPSAADKTHVLKVYAGIRSDTDEDRDIDDPMGGDNEGYVHTRDEIQDALLAIFSRIKEGTLK